MNTPSLAALLSRWEDAFRNGRDLPARELCPDDPKMASELQLAIDIMRRVSLLRLESHAADPAMMATLPPSHDADPSLTLPPSPNTDTPSEFAAVTVPGYAILAELGRGGMGVVYKARQVGLNRIVALKMILSGMHAGEADKLRFKTEAEAVARLQHPGIVQIFDIGDQGANPYLSLEFCPGGSLDHKLRDHPLPPTEAAALVERLAQAMDAAHQARVIHRDLKPANVLLADDGTPKITDFGLAKKLDEQGATCTGSIMGTPSYMSPEQAQGKKDLGPATDIYALGAILYECLTGRPPFRAATPFDTLMQVIGDEPVPPSRLQPGVPRDLETICLKCLQKDAGKRYARAAALADDLRRFQDGEPIQARPVTSLERGLKWVRRNPVVAALLTLIVSVTLVGIGLVFAQWQRAETQRQAAETAEQSAERRADEAQQARTEAEQSQQLAEDRRVQAEQALKEARSSLYFYDLLRAQRDLKAAMPDRAAMLLASCPLDLRGWEWDYLRQQCRDEAILCTGHTGNVVGVSWSPDGKLLASGGTDSTLRFWDPQTGQEKFQLRGHEGWVSPPTFDPKGRWLVSGSAKIDQGLIALGFNWERVVTPQLRLWDWPKRKELRVLEGRGPTVFTPDGEILAVCKGRSILLYETATWTIKHTLTGHVQPVFALLVTPDGKRLISGSYDVNRIPWKAWAESTPLSAPGEIKIWDVESGKESESAIAKSPVGVQFLALHQDSKRLVVGRIDGTVEVVELSTGTILHTLRKQGPRLCGLALAPNGRIAVTRHGVRPLIWDIDTGRELSSPTLLCNQELAFRPDGHALAFGADDGESVRIVDTRLDRDYERYPTPAQMLVSSVGFSHDRKHVAALAGNRLLLWDASTGKEVYSVPTRGARLVFVPNSKHLVTAGVPTFLEGGELYLREYLTGKVVHQFTGHSQTTIGLACSADGRWLASAACNLQNLKQPGDVRIWDLKTRSHVRTISGQPHVFSLALSPDGALVAGASLDKAVYVWERETGKLVQKFTGHASITNAVAFRPDGKQVASGGVDGTILLWDPRTGKQEQELRGHQASRTGDGGIVTLVYSPEGNRLASASYRPPLEGEVKLWDTATGTEALTSTVGDSSQGGSLVASSSAGSVDWRRGG